MFDPEIDGKPEFDGKGRKVAIVELEITEAIYILLFHNL
jgi:hypothetical protein